MQADKEMDILCRRRAGFPLSSEQYKLYTRKVHKTTLSTGAVENEGGQARGWVVLGCFWVLCRLLTARFVYVV